MIPFYGVGRGFGVGRSLGVTLGVAVGVGVDVGVAVGVEVGVALGVTLGVALGVLVGVSVGVRASSTNTQSLSPALLLPGVVKSCVPMFGKDEPEMAVKVFAVGSYQRALTELLKLVSAIVSVFLTGV